MMSYGALGAQSIVRRLLPWSIGLIKVHLRKLQNVSVLASIPDHALLAINYTRRRLVVVDIIVDDPM